MTHRRTEYGYQPERMDAARNRDEIRTQDHRIRVSSIEVTVIPSQDAIDQFAARIEQAYRRRYPEWQSIGVTPGVWSSAASRLMEASEDSTGIPADPELFVAVQVRSGLAPDPWAELTQERSLGRYLKVLRKIVGQLRKELRAEVRRAKGRLLRGMTIDQLLSSDQDGLSPLTRYILAHRAGRLDLSMKYRAAAENQHRSCPLYRMASRSFLPSHAYPWAEREADRIRSGQETIAFSLN